MHRTGHFAPASKPAKTSWRTASVFISGLPEGICKRDIIRAFANFGTVEALHLNIRRNCCVVDLHDEYTSRAAVSTYPFIVKLSHRTNQTARLKLGYSMVQARDLTARDVQAAAEAQKKLDASSVAARMRPQTAMGCRTRTAAPPSGKPGKKRPQSARPAVQRSQRSGQRPQSARAASAAGTARCATTDCGFSCVHRDLSPPRACTPMFAMEEHPGLDGWNRYNGCGADTNSAGIDRWLSIPKRTVVKPTVLKLRVEQAPAATFRRHRRAPERALPNSQDVENSDLTIEELLRNSSFQGTSNLADDGHESFMDIMDEIEGIDNHES